MTRVRLVLALVTLVASVVLTTLPGSTVRAAAGNLALNRPVTASSFETNSPFVATSAVDGNAGTRWSSTFADNQWITVDLGGVTSIGSVVLNWEAAYAKTYRIDLSNDNANWQLGATNTSNGGIETKNLTSGTSARYVRIFGLTRSTQYGISLWELEVYAPATGTVHNISLNKPAYANYWQDSARAPKYAVNGTRDGGGTADNRWASPWIPKAWLSVDLGAVATIRRVELYWEAAYAADFDIQVSNDNANWTTVQSVRGNTSQQNILSFAASGRYIRMNGLARRTFTGGYQYGYSLYEFEVYGYGDNPNVQPVSPPADPTGTWTQVWSDEFNATAVNATNWNYEIGDGTVQGIPGWGNGEKEFYTSRPENVYTEQLDTSGNRALVIQLRKEATPYCANLTNRNTGQTSNVCSSYTSGRITTAGKRVFTYGKVEARLKLPKGVGVWPAFWMLGSDTDDPNVGWPQTGEIDIMENIGYPWWFSASLHGPGYSGGGSIGYSFGKTDNADGSISPTTGEAIDVTQWHNYAVIWYPSHMDFTIDGRLFNSISRSWLEANRGQWVYDNPKFILLNVAYDGAYPNAYYTNPKKFSGPFAPNGMPAEAENFMPHKMYVDWVRVSQLK